MATEPHSLDPIDLRRLTVQQLNAIDLLVTGCSDREAAEGVGVDRSTVTRWRNYHPAFVAELNAQRDAVWGAARERLRSLLPEAVDAVAETIRDRENPNRTRVAIELIRSVKIGDAVSAPRGPTDADAVIKRRTKDRHDEFELMFLVPPYYYEWAEEELQARLHGMSGAEYREALEEQEAEVRRLRREEKRAAKGREGAETRRQDSEEEASEE